jgi:hypothetical protein
VRDRLVAELGAIQSADEAASWARRSLPVKNTLSAADAQFVEARFRIKIDSLGGIETSERLGEAFQPTVATPSPSAPDESTDPAAGAFQSDDSSPARLVAKTIRLRDKEHRKFVAKQPCLVCGRTPAEPHHLRFAQPRALGRKVSDEFIVPVCRLHHRELHRNGDEAAWWAGLSINPVLIALSLWQRSRLDAPVTLIRESPPAPPSRPDSVSNENRIAPALPQSQGPTPP